MKPKLRIASPLPRSAEAGFTIIELMISTLVFSLVLLTITVGVLHFTNDYYRGINSSKTQTTAQNALDTISQAIQFSTGGTVATDGSQGFFCAGTKMFLYQWGVLYNGVTPTSTTSNMGLFVLPNPSTGTCNPSVLTPASFTSGTELLGKNMRVTTIVLTPTSDTTVWQVSLKVIYGDTDLLCSPVHVSNSCAPSYTAVLTPVELQGDDVTCKTQVGSQFCSTSALSTVAQQRIVN